VLQRRVVRVGFAFFPGRCVFTGAVGLCCELLEMFRAGPAIGQSSPFGCARGTDGCCEARVFNQWPSTRAQVHALFFLWACVFSLFCAVITFRLMTKCRQREHSGNGSRGRSCRISVCWPHHFLHGSRKLQSRSRPARQLQQPFAARPQSRRSSKIPFRPTHHYQGSTGAAFSCSDGAERSRSSAPISDGAPKIGAPYSEQLTYYQ